MCAVLAAGDGSGFSGMMGKAAPAVVAELEELTGTGDRCKGAALRCMSGRIGDAFMDAGGVQADCPPVDDWVKVDLPEEEVHAGDP